MASVSGEGRTAVGRLSRQARDRNSGPVMCRSLDRSALPQRALSD